MSPAEVSPAEVSPAEGAPNGDSPAERDSRGPSLGVAFAASEISVLFRRRRTWAMLGALALVPVMIAAAIRLSSSEVSPGRGPAFLDSITQNGLFVALTALTVCIPLFLPLTIGVVAGDTIAGEANLGTLRYLLVTPVARLRLLVVKYLGAALFCLAATVVIVLAGVAIGAALFPIGPVTLLSGDTVDVGGFAVRCLLLALYVTVSLLGFSAIGLFISTLTTVPVGAMAATIVLSAVAQILDALPQLEAVHPLLFTHYWLDFGDLLRQPIAWGSFGDNLVLQAAYVAVFGALAYGRLSTKDILS
ncbi:MAG: hypothetical protein RI885_2378 [Actinomycetota bacterium]